MPPSKLIAQIPRAINMPPLEGVGALATPGDQSGTLLETVVSNVIGILTVFGVIYFAFQIIFAGYGLMSADGDTQKISKHSQKITRGIIGLVVIVAAVFLTRLITSLLGIDNILNVNNWVTNTLTP